MDRKRLDRMNLRMKETKPQLDAERARLVTEAYDIYSNYPPVLRRAYAFAYILDHMKPNMQPEELLVGSLTQRVRGISVFPEFGAKWVLDEMDLFPVRGTDPIVVDPEDKKELVAILEKWGENTFDVQSTRVLDDYVLKAQECGVLSVGARTTGMGHISPDYPRILPLGLRGLIDRSKEMIKNTTVHTPEDMKKVDFWNANIISCEAVIRFAHTYARKAAEQAETETDKARKAELLKIADVCSHVPENEPRDFWEALQFVWFLQMTIQIEDNGHSIAIARLDQNLYKYYKKSVLEGDMPAEDAEELLAALYIKCTEVLKVRDSFDSRAFAAYPMWQQMAIGGLKKDGTDATNELTYAVLRAWDLVKTVQPTMALRVNKNTPDDLMKLALSYVQDGYSIPAFYNDDLVTRLIQNKGATVEDSRDWTVHGCVEPYVQGKSDGRPNVGYVNAAKCIELVMNNGWDPVAKCEMGLKTGDPNTFVGIKDFENALHQQIQHFVKIMCESYTKVCAMHAIYVPKGYASALVTDCISRGKSLEEGGALYNSSGVFLVAMANGADCLEAIDYVVFKEKLLNAKAFNEVLLNNYEGNERLRQIILNKVPKYGNDVEEVDAYANRMIRAYNQEMVKYRDSRGGTYENSILSTSFNVLQGKCIGATPDGRLAGEAVSDNASPMVGRDTVSPTATFKSVASIDQTDINNGSLLNMKFSPSVVKGEKGEEILKDCITSYFALDGEHVQINVVDAETLKDAQRNPEEYRNLLVRVAGYSAYFIELDREVQNNIIGRTAHTNVSCCG
ncbi:glycyl radical protein [Aminipila luticellarii]|uniref:Formate C-acetyltransferase/glycerol dehydratase family glycyl radical enzyme n=1 Tax=Aminipila luticellarii TaxID=2507160 RepID=A0A410PWF4_9FIRM|nr:formate C-acetyltransferase/glycerol dehydratase family glycyl radical enzyme [Aminipila luticellarii]QAT43272.1 formate C-acetyltransferase/glycerol dehydratase family glycyl radical enzyme [Aminipila luticellarii]